MVKKQTLALLGAVALILWGTAYAQEAPGFDATLHYNGIEFSYMPDVFGAALAAYDEGTPYQTDAPYFANVAPHTTFQFLRPDPTRPDVNWVGQLSVYRISDINAYAEPSYRQVVESLQNMATQDLSAYANASADYRTPALPYMPVLNATQVFRARPKALDFRMAKGIEYYVYSSQAAEPILEGQVDYTFQGITTDGLYYLSFSMPVEMGLLATTIPDGMDWDAFLTTYPQYLQQTFATINNADPASFTPSSDVLHRFIESITIDA